jgi:hypothetical protein
VHAEGNACEALQKNVAERVVAVYESGKAHGHKLDARDELRFEANAEVTAQGFIESTGVLSGSWAAVHNDSHSGVPFEKSLSSKPHHALTTSLFVAIGVEKTYSEGASAAPGPRCDTQGDHGEEHTEENEPNNDKTVHP